MKKKIAFAFFAFCAFLGLLEAGTVFLVNDSPYKLRAVVRGSDGSFLGEVVVIPQSTNKWTDGFAGLPSGQNTTRTQTPYTVLWYCLEGQPFSTNYPIATGGTAMAMLGDGAKECHPQRQKEPEGEVPAPPLPIPGQGPNVESEDQQSGY